MNKIFFDSWESLFRTLVITILAYIGLIILLRISGKRTLSKMNAFDLIVTIALGSTLATVLLNKSVALADGLLAFVLLIGLQFAITWLSVRSKTISNMVKASPTLLVYKGKMITPAMKKERISMEEILAIIREKGLNEIPTSGAVVLETDGSLTVIESIVSGKDKALNGVEKPGVY